MSHYFIGSKLLQRIMRAVEKIEQLTDRTLPQSSRRTEGNSLFLAQLMETLEPAEDALIKPSRARFKVFVSGGEAVTEIDGEEVKLGVQALTLGDEELYLTHRFDWGASSGTRFWVKQNAYGEWTWIDSECVE